MKRKKKVVDARVREVQKWFRKSVTYEGEPYVIDAEQAAAVVAEEKNVIVVARAGSGKTRTIVAKIVYLMAKCGVRAEEIMAFVFNANAAREINERLAKMMVDGVSVVGDAGVETNDGGGVVGGANGSEVGVAAKGARVTVKEVKVARTFHAFARHIIYDVCGGREKCGKILVGEREEFVMAIVVGMLREPEWAERIRRFVKGDEKTDEKTINEMGDLHDGGRIEEQELMWFAKMMGQFINRAQQKFLAGKDTLKGSMRRRLREGDVSVRERLFVKLGAECFRRYHWCLLDEEVKMAGYSEYGTDFNLIVSWASKLIARGSGAVRELLAEKKYILIDEYQDFSQLFLSVVLAVRKIVPKVNLFVVGDDWQAINRFAGSDVEYFKEFERYFPEGVRRYEITTNYRCDREVVGRARTFMKRAMGEKGEFRAKSRRVGKVVLVDARRSKAEYLANLVQILRRNRKAKDIMILHRNNETNLKISLMGLRIALKREVIKAGLMSEKDYNKKVRVMTMHKSKGLEAEVVVILEADEGVIPKTHPDTRLYRVFGETEEVALDNQKRLFYVAMTRAKRRLYIMHDCRGEAGFVKHLGRGVERWEE